MKKFYCRECGLGHLGGSIIISLHIWLRYCHGTTAIIPTWFYVPSIRQTICILQNAAARVVIPTVQFVIAPDFATGPRFTISQMNGKLATDPSHRLRNTYFRIDKHKLNRLRRFNVNRLRSARCK
jgi:hypothetical protein